jgi:hypothetical protein
MQSRACFCVFLEDAEHPVWVPSQFVKPHGPKDEETETGRLILGQGTTEADLSTNQRAVKKIVAIEIDAEQRATRLGSNEETNGHDDGNW